MKTECRSCGAQLSAGAFLCPQCGVPVGKPTNQPSERRSKTAWGGLELPARPPSSAPPERSVPAPPPPSKAAPPPTPARRAGATIPIVSRPPPTPNAHAAQRASLDRMEAQGFVSGPAMDQERAVRTVALHSASAAPPQFAPALTEEDDLPAALGGSLAPGPLPTRPAAVRPPPASVRPTPSSAPPARAALGGLELTSRLELDMPSDHRSMRPTASRNSLATSQSPRLRGMAIAEHDAPHGLLSREPLSEVAAVARYGRVPSSLLGCAAYAVRVGLRRMEISNTLARLTSERGRAAAEADRALIQLGQVLYQRRNDPRMEALAPEIERVLSADQTIGERNAAHQDARWQVVDELATIDQVVADTNATIEPIREHEANLQRYLDQLQDNSRRGQARLQRVEIQIRALHGSEEMSDDPDLLPTLEAERRVREQELRAIAEKMHEARQALGEARRELAAHLGTLQALHEDREGRKRTLQEKDNIHKSYAGDAIDAMTYALRLLAHAALDQGFFMVAEPETRKAETAVQRLKDRDRDEELHREAIDAYDTVAVRKGVFVLVTGFLGVLAGLRLIRHMGGHF